MRLTADLAAGFVFDLTAGFRREVTVFVVLGIDLGADFLVAMSELFLGSLKDFLNTAEKFGMFSTYGCARAHAR